MTETSKNEDDEKFRKFLVDYAWSPDSRKLIRNLSLDARSELELTLKTFGHHVRPPEESTHPHIVELYINRGAYAPHLLHRIHLSEKQFTQIDENPSDYPDTCENIAEHLKSRGYEQVPGKVLGIKEGVEK